MDMDWPEFSDFSTVSRQSISPRRELQLQGPRPAPLKVSKESHKIRKPPTAPVQQQQQQQYHPPHHQQQQQQYPQQRQPVIIYTVSPKVIHTNASEFMSLVQRLTGPSPRPRSPSISSGAISPAARFATIEKTNTPSEANKSSLYYNNNNTTTLNRTSDHLDLDLDLFGPEVERTGSFPGILSPVPSTLPLVSPNFFSPPSDHNININNNNNLLLHDWSPVFNKNFFEGGGFMPSPNSGFLTAPITSPNLPFDLFNQFLDF